jgi:hypothetical protein
MLIHNTARLHRALQASASATRSTNKLTAV